ncbi:hypothetical protein R3I94_015591 [Phoxinus phoxinus]|uniref:Uncharacterized protein n=1 Tax=Phoxinus phoxinus TaxID=58324 RepID=A0AAN9CVQ7_9TELE
MDREAERASVYLQEGLHLCPAVLLCPLPFVSSAHPRFPRVSIILMLSRTEFGSWTHKLAGHSPSVIHAHTGEQRTNFLFLFRLNLPQYEALVRYIF